MTYIYTSIGRGQSSASFSGKQGVHYGWLLFMVLTRQLSSMNTKSKSAPFEKYMYKNENKVNEIARK